MSIFDDRIIPKECQQETSRDDPDRIFSQPDHVGKWEARTYTDRAFVGKSKYTGLIMGYMYSFKKENTSYGDIVVLKPKTIADKFHVVDDNAELKTETIREQIAELCRMGYLERTNHNCTYRLSMRLANELVTGDYQIVETDELKEDPSLTGRDLAFRKAIEDANGQIRTAAKYLNVHPDAVRKFLKNQ